jgi:ribosomal protein L4
MRVPLKDMSGKQVGELELSDAVFADTGEYDL